MAQTHSTNLHKLLGELEVQVMEQMWARGTGGVDGVEGEQGGATVRDIATELQQDRPVAYTTVMTVMGHLAEKGLLTRTALDGKTHIYRVALSKDAFLARSSQQMVDTLVADFGDLALAQFLAAVERVDPEKLQRLREALVEPMVPAADNAKDNAAGNLTEPPHEQASEGVAAQGSAQEPEP